MKTRPSPTLAELRRRWEGSYPSPPALPQSRPLIPLWPSVLGFGFGAAGLLVALVIGVSAFDGGPRPQPTAPYKMAPATSPKALPDPIPQPPSPPPKRIDPEEFRNGAAKIISLIADNVPKVVTVPVPAPTPPTPTPQPDPPKPNPAPPAPPVAAAPEPPSVDPVIMVDAPTSRPLGKIIVVRCSRSTNVASMLVHIDPPVAPDDIYQSGDGKDFVFSVPDEGTWTIRVTASGPTGKLDEVIRQVVVGQPIMPSSSGKQPIARPRQAVNYSSLAFNLARQVRNENRKEQAGKVAGSFSSAAGMAGTDMVRTKRELVDATDKLIDRALPGNDYEGWKPFLLEILKYIAADPRASMADLRQIWEQIASGLTRASQ